MRGFTLVELMTTLIVISILAVFASSFSQDFLPRQKIIAKRNELTGFLQQARAEAISRGGIMICATTSECKGFDGSSLYAFNDINNNQRHDANETIVATLTLPQSMHIYRNGWGKQDYLAYDNMGRLHYQNGHFLICDSGLGSTLILNWRGRIRSGSAPQPHQDCP